MSISKNGPSFFSQYWGRRHRYFQMPPSDAATLPELLVASTRLSSWLLASLAIGLILYLLFLGIVILNGGWDWLMDEGNWRYHYLQTPVLISYLLLIRPLVRYLLSSTIETFHPLLSISDPPPALVAEAHSLSRRQEWFALAVGAAAGWLIIRPWQNNPFGPGFLVYHLFVDAFLFGLLGWTIYSGLVMTRFLTTLQRRIRNLQQLGPGTVAPLTRWSVGSALLLMAGILLGLLFMRRGDVLGPENLIFNGMVLLAVALVFLRSGVSAGFLPQLRLLRALGLFVTALLAGTLGYHRLEGWSLLDGLYMTVITMTTIGYGEIQPLSQTGQVFTIFLSLVSIGIGGYAISAAAAFVVEGDLQRIIRGRKMDKQIAQLEDHIIVCGAGRVGMQVVAEFHKTRTPFVVIEHDPEEIEALKRFGDILYLQGDATKDASLRLAGIERARGLVVALADDKDSAFVVLTARSLRPDLRIVTRMTEEENAEKLRRVGANAIASPNAIGGMRLASLMIRPTVVAFLDEMLYVPGATLRMEEVALDGVSSLIGQTLGEADIGRQTGLLVVAIRSSDGQLLFNPGAQVKLKEGDILIVIGTPDQLATLRRGHTGMPEPEAAQESHPPQ
jgi:voltage-gated potassium channel